MHTHLSELRHVENSLDAGERDLSRGPLVPGAGEALLDANLEGGHLGVPMAEQDEVLGKRDDREGGKGAGGRAGGRCITEKDGTL